MFLKRINLKGFKSFADRTVVDFDDGLTIIVGPNGSGKSNINDAIKWVLGESSKKNLRASSSADMIFNGTETEKPADYAEVTLIFNNENKILNIDFREVSVTRRSYRDEDEGDEYFINKSRVRRRDIRDLFMDTGLGNTDLSIISQANVTKIAESKPDELRSILNEAAGVAKYQQQKIEAVRKLDRVNQNLEIFEVKLHELEKVVGPLRKQAETAEKYLEIKKELEKIELALIKQSLETDVILKDNLEGKIKETEEIKESSKIRIAEIKEKLTSINTKLYDLENEVNQLQSKQQELNASVLEEQVGSANALESQIKQTYLGIEELKKIEEDDMQQISDIRVAISKSREEKISLISQKDKIKYRLNTLEFEIKKQTGTQDLNKGTSVILENKNIFDGIHGLVSDIITTKPEFQLALNVALGAVLKNIVVENESTIKEAIAFLKEHKYGTATFIPVQETRSKDLSQEVDNALNNLDGYLGTLSSNIKTKAMFKNLVSSISGRILTFDNIDNALNAAKHLDYKFKIVTLDGDVIFPGFVVRGGYNKQSNKLSNVESLRKETELIKEKIITLEKDISLIDNNIDEAQTKLSSLNTNTVRHQERKIYLETNLTRILDQYQASTGKEFDMSSLTGVEVKQVEGLSLEKINSLIKEKQELRRTLFNQQQELQSNQEEINNKWRQAVEESSEDQIEYDRAINRINTELEILNTDYKLTFDALMERDIEPLTISFEKASDLRTNLREQIADLGFINLESIEEYAKVKGDYDDLYKNTSDLRDSKDKLLSTIDKMDEIMQTQFMENFAKVNTKFDEVFKILFRGGRAELSLEDPEDILESGILIEVQSPGKAINSMRLLSGGEKSLTALSLVFAINLVRELPLLILDEPEAALDEANVERFAKFAKSLNEHSQVIVTTHRPGTMELADVIYGVTMQKKGITKIVTVKLEDAVEMTQ